MVGWNMMRRKTLHIVMFALSLTEKNSLQQSEEFFVWKTGFMRVLTGLIGF